MRLIPASAFGRYLWLTALNITNTIVKLDETVGRVQLLF